MIFLCACYIIPSRTWIVHNNTLNYNGNGRWTKNKKGIKHEKGKNDKT